MAPADDELSAWMALARIAGEGRGGRWWRLARGLGAARAVLAADEGALRAAGLNDAGVAALRGFSGWEDLLRTRARCRELGIAIIAIDDRRYPQLLREIDDPPLLLYCLGQLPAADTPAVAVVGSRRASRYGLRVAGQLGRQLAKRGITVVSGLASGVDAAVHRGALESGAGIAVLAGGLDRVTPRSNRALARSLQQRGALISEHPPGTPPLPARFPVRNRIITGTARATVVVEAAERSGSLVSARLAAEQGREVLAVPGNLDSPTSRGTNRLIRDGCAPLLVLEDLLTAS